MVRAGMLRMPAQYIARNALGFIWATSVDSGPTKTKGLLLGSNCSRVFVVVHAALRHSGANTIAPTPRQVLGH
jgi:hypothetical protein